MTEAVRWGAITRGDFLVLERAKIALQMESLSSNQEASPAVADGRQGGGTIAALPKPLYILASGVGGLGRAGERL
jgi:hypothetical protein